MGGETNGFMKIVAMNLDVIEKIGTEYGREKDFSE